MNPEQRGELLELAGLSILFGLKSGRSLAVDHKVFENALGRHGASFVTLRREGRLRGCIGTLEAVRPLVTDVAENAFSAAFRDHRFTPIEREELDDLALHLSLLQPPERMVFGSQTELLDQLRPGVDGLVIEDQGRRATFLPSVWESLAEPEAFLGELKQKAGLSADHWSASLVAQRYTVEEFGGDADQWLKSSSG